LVQRLQQALGDAYHVELELGGGGMSRVFVATETALGRKVVLKVLPPELGAGLNIDRFRREIQLAASLQHPHIVPLHAAGQADGLPYFTMPLIEGEALRAKLAREGEQPVGETIRILRDIVDALAYAHGRGVVHRDIKPDNVLISHHHALVTDFGVAKALSESTGQGAFTSAGVALGTPAYMAPEQASADPHTDYRADIYAVGAVAYEMLTGRPPFTGPTVQAVLAAQVTKRVEPIEDLRPSVPPGLQALVMRCLEKKPADRWQTAEELLHQLEAVATPSGGLAPTAAVHPVRRPRRWGLIAAVIGAIALGWLLNRRPSEDATEMNPRAVAVFPFRVSGADPSLGYLGEGMVELLAVKLTGEGGLRAVDPSAALSAWRRLAGGQEPDRTAAIELARRLGASKALHGSIVGSPTHLTLTAALLAAGSEDARISVEGPLDSLSNLIDRLAGSVLAGGTGTSSQLAELTTASLPALRAYLDGQSSYRQGSYQAAVRHFQRALEIDSTFALAALGLANAGGWIDFNLQRVGIKMAWRERDRLGSADEAMLEALAGPHYPAPSSHAEILRAWERVVDVAPDRPDAWYGLGDELYHMGPVLGLPDAWQRSQGAFQRALQLDSTFAGPLQHMVEMAARAGDLAKAERLAHLALAGDSATEIAGFIRWRLANAEGDSAELERLRAESGGMPVQSLGDIIALGQHDGLDITAAMAAVTARLGTRDERNYAEYAVSATALNGGRPTEPLRWRRASLRAGEDPGRSGFTISEVLQAAFWEGDTSAGLGASQQLALLEAAHPDSPTPILEQIQGRCELEQWRLSRGELRTVDRTLEFLRKAATAQGDTSTNASATWVCVRLLDAWQAVLHRNSEAARKVAALDSVSRTGPSLWVEQFQHLNLVLARLFEAEGDLPHALQAIRRRHFQLGIPLYLSSYLREEGRLAALNGDRAGAIQAYQHYLALRRDPEPAVVPRVNEVRAELAKLLAER
jgi:eukaryotic-like serine/threonine-protein kinase